MKTSTETSGMERDRQLAENSLIFNESTFNFQIEMKERNGVAKWKSKTRPFGKCHRGDPFRGGMIQHMVPITRKDKLKVLLIDEINRTRKGETPNVLPGITKQILFRTEPDHPVPL